MNGAKLFLTSLILALDNSRYITYGSSHNKHNKLLIKVHVDLNIFENSSSLSININFLLVKFFFNNISFFIFSFFWYI